MSQILSQVPRALLQQQQRLTPQLIQAMDILQLNALALESRVAQEIDGNPALEYAPGDDEAHEAAEPPAVERVESRTEDERALSVGRGDGAEFDRLDRLVSQYDFFEDDEYRGGVSRNRMDEDSERRADALASVPDRPEGLHKHLMEQWALVEVDDRTRSLGAQIIEALEESGRLETPLASLGQDLTPPATADELEQALAAVQELDPPGVASRTIQECLLLQLDALPGENTLERRIVAGHMEDLQKNRLPQIAKALGVDVEEVKAAVAVIGTLSLHPGAEVASRVTPPITPDLVVEYDAERDQYDVRLTRANTRELRISPEFRELLEQSRRDPKAREFAKQKIDAASAIIDAVRYRRERLLEVGRAVVEAQREFLDKGEQFLRVLRMSDLAARVGCDPSTISRTVDGKYIETPRGVYPLRYFFTGGAATDDGDALGWASIRAKVQDIIEREDKSKPLSDDEIVDKLAALGIEIKRRTVAKYRAQLDIPPARQRRRY